MEDFYPTPRKLIEKMLSGIDFSMISTVLEPSAGKGDICDYLKDRRVEIDCIEIEPDLQAALIGKGHRLVFGDFLKFETNKRYDLILANFPFSDGDKHLQHAIEILEKSGGALVCLVNAETIRNPYTNLRKSIVNLLEKYEASIEYLQGEFTEAERKTDVEVALIRLFVEDKAPKTIILDSLRKESTIEVEELETTAVIDNSPIKQLITLFDFESKVGLRLINEWFVLKPYLKESLKKEEYERDSIIKLEIRGAYSTKTSYINSYLREARYKYWKLLLSNQEFRNKYTSNLLNEIERKLEELRDYDFNEFNIEKLTEEMNRKINSGIDNTILSLFDEFSSKHWYSDEMGKNIHYFNGWKTNKAHRINKKVILPINGFSSYSYTKDALDTYKVKEKMSDMVKVFNYLAGDVSDIPRLVGSNIEHANTTENFRDVHMHYFKATFYKKGTCHITFLDQKLLDKFNIYGSQRKGWLPPSYGKKTYREMDEEEKRAIDEFQGEEEYNKTIRERDYYLVQENQLLLTTNP